jgi:hypothetical protein
MNRTPVRSPSSRADAPSAGAAQAGAPGRIASAALARFAPTAMSHICSAALAMPWQFQSGSPPDGSSSAKWPRCLIHLGPATECAVAPNSKHLCLNIDQNCSRARNLTMTHPAGNAVSACGRSAEPEAGCVTELVRCRPKGAVPLRPAHRFCSNFARHPCLRPIRRAQKTAGLVLAPRLRLPMIASPWSSSAPPAVVRQSTVELGAPGAGARLQEYEPGSGSGAAEAPPPKDCLSLSASATRAWPSHWPSPALQAVSAAGTRRVCLAPHFCSAGAQSSLSALLTGCRVHARRGGSV